MNEKLYISDQDPQLFERMVLRVIDSSRQAFERYKTTLCKTDNAAWTQGFMVPAHNAIYMALHEYHSILSAHPVYKPADENIFRAFITQQASQGSAYIGLDEIDEAVDYLRELRQMDEASSRVIVDAEYERWIKKSRLNSAMNAIQQIDGWDPDVLINKVTAAGKMDETLKGKTRFEFGECMDMHLPVRQRYPLPDMNDFNRVLGGGFAHGEFSGIIAPTGGGKTVMALQIATGLATNGLKVLMVTTEQSPRELEPRIVSAKCRIPFRELRDGFDLRKLPKFQQDSIMHVRQTLRNQLWIEDWSQKRGVSIMDDLDGLILDFIKEHGHLDALVFDWLGGALGELTKNDMNNYRLIMKNSGECLGKLADIHDIITVSFAQANIKQAWNKRKVDATMTGECKSVFDKAENIYGISCLLAPDALEDDVSKSYKDEQFFYSSKSRKAPGLGCTLWRDFDFQCFTDRKPARRPDVAN